MVFINIDIYQLQDKEGSIIHADPKVDVSVGIDDHLDTWELQKMREKIRADIKEGLHKARETWQLDNSN